MYSRKAKEILEQYGWYEGRKIDISEHLTIFASLGIELFDKAKEFIQEFDGLKIPSRSWDFDENNRNHFHYFDVLYEIKGMYDILLEKKGETKKNLMTHRWCQEKVFPVGGLSGWGVGLYITESGKMVSDRFIYGNTIEESVENLVLHKSLGSITPPPPKDPVKDALRRERTKEVYVSYITKLSLDKENGIVSWHYESNVIKIGEVKNCTWRCVYSKLYVMITTKENEIKKRTLYDAKANFVFAYTLDENKIFTSETDYYIVNNLEFVAYDRWNSKLVVLTGNTPAEHKLYVYDLNGNMLAQVQPPEGLFISSAQIDTVGYILINCQPISQLSENTKENEVGYDVNYDNYALVKNIMFD